MCRHKYGSDVKVDKLNPGDYAAFSFHDKNRNGKVDSNVRGVPVEPFTLSARRTACAGA